MRTPKLNALEAFVVSGHYLNFRLAAEELALTQGAVAAQVRGLEAALGVALFQRHARGLAFTEEGRRYHEAVARSLGEIGRATEALRARGSDVTISVPPSFATKWLMPRLASFSEAHPGITLKVMAEERLADIASGRADLAVRQAATPSGHGMTVIRIAPMDLMAVGAPSLAPVERLEEFATLDLIEDGHNGWERAFSAAGLVHRGRMLRVNQTALAMDAAISGQGVALVPRLYLAEALKAGMLRVLWQPATDEVQGFHLVHTNAPTVAVRRVAGWIKAQVSG